MTLCHSGEKVLQLLQTHLAESLTAVYLHGSAVTSGLRPKSDIDLLAVVDKPLTDRVRELLLKELLHISGRLGDKTRRPVELIIFLQADFSDISCPCRCEFLYGEWLRTEFETGKIPGSLYDPELTLVLAQARLEAQALLGPPAREIIPDISTANIYRAIKDLLPSLVNSQEGDECNVLLTLARMWLTLTTGTFASKDAAAQWATPRLPTREAAVISEARQIYLGLLEDHLSLQKQDVQDTVRLLTASIKELLATVDPCDD